MIDQDKTAQDWVSRRGAERNRERAREVGPSRREESWAPEEGKQRVLGGLRRGDSG